MEKWRILGESLLPGERRNTALRVPMGGLQNHGELLPGTRAGDDYEIPVILINGRNPGKTLLVTAGMHAGEYNGTPAVIRAAKALDPEHMSGRVILIPCVNTSGFWTMHPRVTPEDEFNFNGQYPGRADGTVGERIADCFVREIFPHLDFILDLHGGSRGERMTPLCFFPTHPKVRTAALEAAKALNLGFMIESQATKGQYSYAASAMDIPGLLIERGDGYFCERQHVEADWRDVMLLIDHLSIEKAPKGLQDESLKRRVFREAVYLESDVDALWYPAVDRDEDISKGQVLGRLEDFFGNLIAEPRAGHDGHVLYYNSGLAMPKGELLVAYAVADSEE